MARRVLAQGVRLCAGRRRERRQRCRARVRLVRRVEVGRRDLRVRAVGVQVVVVARR